MARKEKPRSEELYTSLTHPITLMMGVYVDPAICDAYPYLCMEEALLRDVLNPTKTFSKKDIQLICDLVANLGKYNYTTILVPSDEMEDIATIYGAYDKEHSADQIRLKIRIALGVLLEQLDEDSNSNWTARVAIALTQFYSMTSA